MSLCQYYTIRTGAMAWGGGTFPLSKFPAQNLFSLEVPRAALQRDITPSGRRGGEERCTGEKVVASHGYYFSLKKHSINGVWRSIWNVLSKLEHTDCTIHFVKFQNILESQTMLRYSITMCISLQVCLLTSATIRKCSHIPI